MSKRFPTDLASRGALKLTDKLLVHNIDTGVTQYTTVSEMLDALGLKGQVKFPAVQIPSTNVNTLDDYEEGTWTPVLAFGGASVGITYTTQEGTYTKIGNIVFLRAVIQLSNKGASVGTATITGLTFSANVYPIPVLLHLSAITFADYPEGILSGATITLRECTNAGVLTNLSDADFANNSYILLSCVFRVA